MTQNSPLSPDPIRTSQDFSYSHVCVFFTLKPEPETTQHYACHKPKTHQHFSHSLLQLLSFQALLPILSFFLSTPPTTHHPQQQTPENQKNLRSHQIWLFSDKLRKWVLRQLAIRCHWLENCEPGIAATCQERHRRSGPWEKKTREEKGSKRGGQRAKDSLRCKRPPLLCSGALNPNFKSHKVRS